MSAVAELADLLTGADASRALTAREKLARIAADDIPLVATAAQSILGAQPQPSGRPSAKPAPAPREAPPPDAPPRVPAPSPKEARRQRLPGLIAIHKARSAAVSGVLLALIVGTWVLGAGGTGGDSGQTGRAISMLPVGGERVMASAYLKQYSSPPPLLHMELTPGGARYQLLLFDDLSAVRSFKRLPSSAFLVHVANRTEI